MKYFLYKRQDVAVVNPYTFNHSMAKNKYFAMVEKDAPFTFKDAMANWKCLWSNIINKPIFVLQDSYEKASEKATLFDGIKILFVWMIYSIKLKKFLSIGSKK